MLLGAKHPWCIFSVFSDTTSGCIHLFLELDDNFLTTFVPAKSDNDVIFCLQLGKKN